MSLLVFLPLNYHFPPFQACCSSNNTYRDWAWTGVGKDLNPDDWRKQLEKWIAENRPTALPDVGWSGPTNKE
ncbi:MAG: hypothetical protein GH151_07625 [Bacteroidetes bacterium]|nr:hypothetical protein [Bacteroidota bacterium]